MSEPHGPSHRAPQTPEVSGTDDGPGSLGEPAVLAPVVSLDAARQARSQAATPAPDADPEDVAATAASSPADGATAATGGWFPAAPGGYPSAAAAVPQAVWSGPQAIQRSVPSVVRVPEPTADGQTKASPEARAQAAHGPEQEAGLLGPAGVGMRRAVILLVLGMVLMAAGLALGTWYLTL